MKKKKNIQYLIGDVVGLLLCFFVFIIPFLFMILNSLKERREANKLSLSLPAVPQWQNFAEVIKTNDYQILQPLRTALSLQSALSSVWLYAVPWQDM